MGQWVTGSDPLTHRPISISAGRYAVIGCNLKQNANEGCNSKLCKSCRTCFKFYCMFYFTCDRSFKQTGGHKCNQQVFVSSRERRVITADLLHVDVTLWLDQQLSRWVAVGHRSQAGDVLKYWLIFHFHLLHSSPVTRFTTTFILHELQW